MEIRNGNLILGKAGGTASAGSRTYKLALPSSWIKELGLGEDARAVELRFDGRQIVVGKRQTLEEFREAGIAEGHEMTECRYYNRDQLCTRIYADGTTKELKAENYTDSAYRTAFGQNQNPTWRDFQAFLESRCIPRQRAGLQSYLESIGVEDYDPIQIIQKTEGRMAEDEQWLQIQKIK